MEENLPLSQVFLLLIVDIVMKFRKKNENKIKLGITNVDKVD